MVKVDDHVRDDQLVASYSNDMLSIRGVCILYGLPYTTVRNRLKNAGVCLRARGDRRALTRSDRRLIEYLGAGNTWEQASVLFGDDVFGQVKRLRDRLGAVTTGHIVGIAHQRGMVTVTRSDDRPPRLSHEDVEELRKLAAGEQVANHASVVEKLKAVTTVHAVWLAYAYGLVPLPARAVAD